MRGAVILKQPVIFGEVLFDRFPDGAAVLGGAPFNVAWNLKALGAEPLLVSRVGCDQLARQITTAMGRWDLTTTGLQRDPDHGTGTVTVSVNAGEPTYDIVPDQAYDHIGYADLPPLEPAPLLYHGSLALRASPAREALARLRRRTGADVFMDVNLRDPWWNREAVVARLRQARWVKLNEDELDRLVPGLPDNNRRADQLLGVSTVECLIVTRGADGVWFRDRQGRELAPPGLAASTVRDTVGAGDAFSSVVILGLLAGWTWPLILERALGFAAAVVGLRGATTEDREFYEPFKANWELT